MPLPRTETKTPMGVLQRQIWWLNAIRWFYGNYFHCHRLFHCRIIRVWKIDGRRSDDNRGSMGTLPISNSRRMI